MLLGGIVSVCVPRRLHRAQHVYVRAHTYTHTHTHVLYIYVYILYRHVDEGVAACVGAAVFILLGLYDLRSFLLGAVRRFDLL
jgi:hypothetical protein